MVKPFIPMKPFEIGDLVSPFPGTPPHDQLTHLRKPISGQLYCVPIGIVLAGPRDGGGTLWGRYDVQWFSPKKMKTEGVRSFYLEKILGTCPK